MAAIWKQNEYLTSGNDILTTSTLITDTTGGTAGNFYTTLESSIYGIGSTISYQQAYHPITNLYGRKYIIGVDYSAEKDGIITQEIRFSDDTRSTYAISEWELLQQKYPFQIWKTLNQKQIRIQKLKNQHRSTQSLRGVPSFVDKLSPQEITALQLLRSLVSQENFRKYLKYGFVEVQGHISGMKYVVYRRKNTVVYDGLTEVASLCVHLKGNQPPTDEVIAKILMVECSEQEIWERANRYFRNKTPRLIQLGFDNLGRIAA